MYWDFILWLVAFLMQAALLGMTMYTVGHRKMLDSFLQLCFRAKEACC